MRKWDLSEVGLRTNVPGGQPGSAELQGGDPLELMPDVEVMPLEGR